MSNERILVVAPHATRTGSTQVLLDLLAGLDTDLQDRLTVEIRADGARRDDLQAFGPPPRAGEPFSAMLVNSCLAADVVLDRPDVPAAVYVHEPASALATLDDRILAGLRAAKRVLCVSDDVVAGVVQHGVPVDRTVVIPPIISQRAVAPADVAEAARQAGGGPGRRLVVGCGEASARKGTDLFLEVAAALAEDPTLCFAWAGRRLLPFHRQLDLDVHRATLDDRMTWLGEVEEPRPLLAAAAVVVMSSRYDPLPLVPLEAALVGTPTVAFGVGGLADLADLGVLDAAPFADAVSVARAARRILDEPDHGRTLVEAAREHVAVRQSPAVVLPLVHREMRALLSIEPGSLGLQSGE